jgi:hypothetical protein
VMLLPGTLGSLSVVTGLTSSPARQRGAASKVPAVTTAAAARICRGLMKERNIEFSLS